MFDNVDFILIVLNLCVHCCTVFDHYYYCFSIEGEQMRFWTQPTTTKTESFDSKLSVFNFRTFLYAVLEWYKPYIRLVKFERHLVRSLDGNVQMFFCCCSMCSAHCALHTLCSKERDKLLQSNIKGSNVHRHASSTVN